MKVIDVDAHFHEPIDWLTAANPKLAAELPPPVPFGIAFAMNAGGRLPGNSFRFSETASEGFTRPPEDEESLVRITGEFSAHLKKAQAMQPESYEPDSGNPYYDAAARVKFCDAEGIDVQFLNPTMSLVQGGVRVAESGHLELMPELLRTYNRWAGEQLHGYSDRLIAVTETIPSDPEWTIAEMTAMRGAGSRVFHLPQPTDKSYTHPDYEPMWSAAEDLGMAAYIHLPFVDGPPHPSFANNGRGPDTYRHLGGLAETPMTRHFLMAMVFDGVFERHPRLRVLLAECGHSWLPGFLFDIDAKTTRVAMDGTPQDNFYHLPLKPSEYIQRQVRVATLPGFIRAGVESLTVQETLERLPNPDVLVFSSDYPHVEGKAEAVTFFEQLLPADAGLRERFFGGSAADFLGL
jgi:predicted TIM-barrel fold metal-dependent hydrolase